MKHRLAPLALALALCLSACGGGGESAPSPSPDPTPTAAPVSATPTPAPTPEPTPVPDEKVNPLTGLPIAGETTAAQRPVAVMLNNLRVALPQQGPAQADVIYEVLAEGGITRMLAVYQSMEGVGKLGSVRSSRPYYLDLALGLDAIYVHAGGSDEAYDDIAAWRVTSVDYVRTGAYNDLFWRDDTRRRTMGAEHSVLTSGESILEHFPNYSFRKDHPEDYALPYVFSDAAAPAEGESAQSVTVPFSNYKTGLFLYDADLDQYLVEEYGAPYIDGNTGRQVSVTNVLILRTSCTPIDAEGRLRVDLAGHGGEGWFACGGKYIPIAWSKADRDSPIVYATLDGAPLTLGRGTSYVSIIPTSQTPAFA